MDDPAIAQVVGSEKGKEVIEDDENKDCCVICLADEANMERGKLDSCDHFFCFSCIMEWSQVESRCPVCKRRFLKVHRMGGDAPPSQKKFGSCPQAFRIPLRDQKYTPTEEELLEVVEPYSHVACTECAEGSHEELLLLCDGCDAAAHTFCVGLGHSVPLGEWYCGPCQARRGGGWAHEMGAGSEEEGWAAPDEGGLEYEEDVDDDDDYGQDITLAVLAAAMREGPGQRARRGRTEAAQPGPRLGVRRPRRRRQPGRWGRRARTAAHANRGRQIAELLRLRRPQGEGEGVLRPAPPPPPSELQQRLQQMRDNWERYRTGAASFSAPRPLASPSAQAQPPRGPGGGGARGASSSGGAGAGAAEQSPEEARAWHLAQQARALVASGGAEPGRAPQRAGAATGRRSTGTAPAPSGSLQGLLHSRGEAEPRQQPEGANGRGPRPGPASPALLRAGGASVGGGGGEGRAEPERARSATGAAGEGQSGRPSGRAERGRVGHLLDWGPPSRRAARALGSASALASQPSPGRRGLPTGIPEPSNGVLGGLRALCAPTTNSEGSSGRGAEAQLENGEHGAGSRPPGGRARQEGQGGHRSGPSSPRHRGSPASASAAAQDSAGAEGAAAAPGRVRAPAAETARAGQQAMACPGSPAAEESALPQRSAEARAEGQRRGVVGERPIASVDIGAALGSTGRGRKRAASREAEAEAEAERASKRGRVREPCSSSRVQGHHEAAREGAATPGLLPSGSGRAAVEPCKEEVAALVKGRLTPLHRAARIDREQFKAIARTVTHSLLDTWRASQSSENVCGGCRTSREAPEGGHWCSACIDLHLQQGVRAICQRGGRQS